MKLFKIHTEENGKDVDFGVHGVYADNEEDAIKYAETEIVADFLSMGYKVEVGRMPKRSIIYGIIYVWNNEDTKYRKIIIWTIKKEKENTINKVKIKEHNMNIDIKFSETSEWFKTAKAIPNTNLLVEVKSDYFPNGENYAALVDTEYGTNWLYFGSDSNNKAKIIPFDYVSEWRWIEVKKMSKEFEEVRKVIKKHFNEAPCGLFFSRNTIGDRMDTIYNKNGIQIDICYNCQYFEVFGLDLIQQVLLKKYYDFLYYSKYKVQEEFKSEWQVEWL